MIKVVGYQPRPGTPLEDYADFPVGMKLSFEEVDQMTDMGHFPPGLILQATGNPPVVVRGHYHETQRVEVMEVK